MLSACLRAAAVSLAVAAGAPAAGQASKAGPPSALRFDFGPGKVKPGHTRVAASDLYTKESGYGFEPGAGGDCGAEGDGEAAASGATDASAASLLARARKPRRLKRGRSDMLVSWEAPT